MLAKKLLIEAVTVCVSYSDFLAETIPYNLQQIDLWTVVTSPEDRGTRGLCAHYGINCLATDCLYRDVEPPRLNKSRGINYGLAHHSHSGWMIHLDADIVLPPQFRRMVQNAELDETCLYGMDRVDCFGAERWDALRRQHTQYESGFFIKVPGGLPVGARGAHGDYGGYVPIGYFQMWHPKSSGIGRYPIKIDADMEHTDVLFAIQWPRQRRQLLPEGYCVHLATTGVQGNNWHGRKSPGFRGTTPTETRPAAEAVCYRP